MTTEQNTLAIPPHDVLIFRACRAYRTELRTPEPDPQKCQVEKYAGKTWIHVYSGDGELLETYKYYEKSAQIRKYQ